MFVYFVVYQTQWIFITGAMQEVVHRNEVMSTDVCEEDAG